MASGSGENQEDNQTKEPVDVLCEESCAASTTAIAAVPPPPAPLSERLQEQTHGQLEAGGRNPSPATTAEAAAPAQPKDKGIMAPSSRSSAGGKPFLPPRAASASRAREPGAGPPVFKGIH
ncbi:hypothetical protein HU200_043555 [Digitaria exilis]|uniref:Uncharacterized protein n=1 Tax=Digitaria exilis TaxID=1010633 RepID=A0A835B394_9POAL|nr:hypothetical protein HU200_043555 [Digitaria exilis]